MRINKYLALKNYATRRGADELISKKLVTINGKFAVLGDKVNETDVVEVRSYKKPAAFVYYAYNKPFGINSDPTLKGENDILSTSSLKGVFPVIGLEKNSHGLVVLTNDRRTIDRMVNPKHSHEKEYSVKVNGILRPNFKEKVEAGMNLENGESVTGSKITNLKESSFNIIMTDSKNPIRQICSLLFAEVKDIECTRIINIKLGKLAPNSHRVIKDAELEEFLKNLGL
ncbi:MAG: pseudouridine synthase [Candidatus Paceibacterota bacterium]|jgi:pseudouridine synthase